VLYIDYGPNCNYYHFCFITFRTISFFWSYFSFLLSPRQNSWLIFNEESDFCCRLWNISLKNSIGSTQISYLGLYLCLSHQCHNRINYYDCPIRSCHFVWELCRPVRPVQLYRPKTHFNAYWWLYVIQTVPCTGHFRGASGLPFTSKDINLQANSGTDYMFVFHNKSGHEGGGED
jgi:hypothetical protein